MATGNTRIWGLINSKYGAEGTWNGDGKCFASIQEANYLRFKEVFDLFIAEVIKWICTMDMHNVTNAATNYTKDQEQHND